MASPEAVELRARDDGELRHDLEEAHQALFNLRFQASTRQLADVAQVGNAKRRIARIRTLIREREILAEVDAIDDDATDVDQAADDDQAADVDQDDEQE
jgi:large subunit ribosomal protein L29